MLEKLSFFVFFLLDLFFVVSGLLYLRSFPEAIWGLLFLVFVWYIMWSANKIRMYIQEKSEVSFAHYYFNYVLTAIDTIGKDIHFGPTRFYRIASMSLSTLGGVIGISTVIFLNYDNIVTALGTKGLLVRYAILFLYISVYPLVTLFLRTLASSSNTTGRIGKLLEFFPLRFTQLFMYIFTFLTPVAWIAVAFLSYIITKSKTIPNA